MSIEIRKNGVGASYGLHPGSGLASMKQAKKLYDQLKYYRMRLRSLYRVQSSSITFRNPSAGTSLRPFIHCAEAHEEFQPTGGRRLRCGDKSFAMGAQRGMQVLTVKGDTAGREKIIQPIAP